MSMAKHGQTSADEHEFARAELRVDQPHASQPGVPHTSGERGTLQLVGVGIAAEAIGITTAVENSLEQLREHAAQLSDRLQAEQSQLDRREETLAAREADLDAKWENARAWLDE